jgi:putative spermidine/putrescine transport system permease protein
MGLTVILASFGSPMERISRGAFYAYCAGVFLFLVVPILTVIPLSFSSDAFLTYPLPSLSLRWYEDFFTSPRWLPALMNSLLIAAATTLIATPLGTLAALGLVRMDFRFRPLFVSLLISPMIVPGIITAVGMYFVYSPLGLTSSYSGLILAHTVLAAPFVVIVVLAALEGFDPNLMRAGASLGAPPMTVFLRIVLPMIVPAMVAGAVFAFATSFDEIITAIFLAGPTQRTLPLQMFDGLRERISPTVTAAATFLIVVSVLLLTTVELLRPRGIRKPIVAR